MHQVWFETYLKVLLKHRLIPSRGINCFSSFVDSELFELLLLCNGDEVAEVRGGGCRILRRGDEETLDSLLSPGLRDPDFILLVRSFPLHVFSL